MKTAPAWKGAPAQLSNLKWTGKPTRTRAGRPITLEHGLRRPYPPSIHSRYCAPPTPVRRFPETLTGIPLDSTRQLIRNPEVPPDLLPDARPRTRPRALSLHRLRGLDDRELGHRPRPRRARERAAQTPR